MLRDYVKIMLVAVIAVLIGVWVASLAMLHSVDSPYAETPR